MPSSLSSISPSSPDPSDGDRTLWDLRYNWVVAAYVIARWCPGAAPVATMLEELPDTVSGDENPLSTLRPRAVPVVSHRLIIRKYTLIRSFPMIHKQRYNQAIYFMLQGRPLVSRKSWWRSNIDWNYDWSKLSLFFVWGATLMSFHLLYITSWRKIISHTVKTHL